MKISAVKATLNEQDVLSIIEDYLQVEGLKIENIKINELITVKGTYKKKITIPFEAKIGLGNIFGNIVNAKVFNLHVSKIGIIRSIRNIALKKLLEDFSEYGIKVDKDNITANLDLVSKLIPYFFFKLKKINVMNGFIEVEAEEVVYAENKKVPSMRENSELSPILRKNCEPSPMPDKYSEIRDKIVDKVPDKYEKIVQYAMIVPDIITLLWRLFRDKRVKIKVKIMVSGVIAYLASPIDILPDFLPIIGQIDDVAIAFFGLNAIMNEVPEEIILQNWQGEENIILMTKEAVNYISKVVGAQNVNKLIGVLKNIFKKGKEDIKTPKLKLLPAQGKNINEHTFEEAAAVNERSNDIH